MAIEPMRVPVLVTQAVSLQDLGSGSGSRRTPILPSSGPTCASGRVRVPCWCHLVTFVSICNELLPGNASNAKWVSFGRDPKYSTY